MDKAFKDQAQKDYQQKELEKLGLTPEDEQHAEIIRFMTTAYQGVVDDEPDLPSSERNLFIHRFIDSIPPLLLLGFKKKATLLTLSSGAGFPAMPIAVFRPDLEITMVEDDPGKRAFLEACVKKVGLSNVTVSEKSSSNHEGTYDYVVQRGAETLQSFTRVGKKFITSEGRLYVFHTSNFHEELSEITMNKASEGVCVSEIAEYDLANQVHGLNLVAFELY